MFGWSVSSPLVNRLYTTQSSRKRVCPVCAALPMALRIQSFDRDAEQTSEVDSIIMFKVGVCSAFR